MKIKKLTHRKTHFLKSLKNIKENFTQACKDAEATIFCFIF